MARPRKDGQAPRKARHVHLTDATLKKMETPDRRVIYYDRNLKGFCLQIEPSGHRSWKYHYRIGGRPCWYHVADVRELPSAKAAREIVEKLNARRVLDETYDPHAEKLVVRASGTFQADLEKYLTHYRDAHPKSYVHTRWTLERYLGAWGKQKSQTIKRAEVMRWFDRQAKSSKSSANQSLAHLSGFFKWLIYKEMIAGPNPCAGIKNHSLKSRERILDRERVDRRYGRRPGAQRQLESEHRDQDDRNRPHRSPPPVPR